MCPAFCKTVPVLGSGLKETLLTLTLKFLMVFALIRKYMLLETNRNCLFVMVCVSVKLLWIDYKRQKGESVKRGRGERGQKGEGILEKWAIFEGVCIRRFSVTLFLFSMNSLKALSSNFGKRPSSCCFFLDSLGVKSRKRLEWVVFCWRIARLKFALQIHSRSPIALMTLYQFTRILTLTYGGALE